MKFVSNELTKLGAIETVYRGMTENDNAILDTKFEKIDESLEKKLKKFLELLNQDCSLITMLKF